jgi:hypothetical protein
MKKIEHLHFIFDIQTINSSRMELDVSGKYHVGLMPGSVACYPGHVFSSKNMSSQRM